MIFNAQRDMYFSYRAIVDIKFVVLQNSEFKRPVFASSHRQGDFCHHCTSIMPILLMQAAAKGTSIVAVNTPLWSCVVSEPSKCSQARLVGPHLSVEGLSCVGRPSFA